MTRSNYKTRSHAARPHAGFSLVELMVAMALSLILLAGVMTIFASSRTTYETTDRLSRIQESGRFALDSIVRDLRSAGYLGCSKRADFTNALNGPATALNNFENPVQGFDAQGTSWLPALDTDAAPSATPGGTIPGSDVLVVRLPRGDFEPVRVVEGEFMSSTTADVIIDDVTPALIEVGDVVQISDCNGRAVFQVTANTAGVLEHEVVGATSDTNGRRPGNATNDIGWAFTDSAELVPVQSIVYYLRDGSTPGAGTSLWRRVSSSPIAEELVEGVENMQLAFGVASGSAITYLRADQVTAANWANIRTVRIALLVRSLSEYGTDTDQQDYDLLGSLGTTVPDPGDRHLRQVFTTTVNIRNSAI